MWRWVRVLVIVGLTAVLVGSDVVARAQTGDLDAFCAKRVELEGVEKKKPLLAGLTEMVELAPPDVGESMSELRDLFAKQGFRAFESEALGAVEEFIYQSCPGAKVAITAIDYEYPDAPQTLPPGLTHIKLVNDAPEEEHEIGILPLRAGKEDVNLEKALGRKEKQQAKIFDFDRAGFAFAPPGQAGYGVVELEPGTYAYACFLPVGGKKKGDPHWSQGMYGTFTVE